MLLSDVTPHFKPHARFAVLSLTVLALIICLGNACRQREKQVGAHEKITIAYSTLPHLTACSR